MKEALNSMNSSYQSQSQDKMHKRLAFYASVNFRDTIRKAISIESDTGENGPTQHRRLHGDDWPRACNFCSGAPIKFLRNQNK